MYKSELDLQAKVWRWFYSEFPEYRVNSKDLKQPRCLLIHNLLNAKSVVEGAKLAGCGLTKGVPDLTLLVPKNGYGALFIELKIGNNKPEKHQKEYMERLETMGYKCCWVNNLDDAITHIKNYLGIL